MGNDQSHVTTKIYIKLNGYLAVSLKFNSLKEQL